MPKNAFTPIGVEVGQQRRQVADGLESGDAIEFRLQRLDAQSC